MDKRRIGPAGEGGNGAATTADQHGLEVPLAKIQHNPWQPRKTFDPDELASLSASVKEHGILQPLVVRVLGDHYQLIAGERRLRAAQQAGLHSVPVRVVQLSDQQVVEAALAENIQRTDLNPIEKAQGFKDYVERFGVNHEQLAQRIGLARSTITNLINLLELAPEVQEGLRQGQITEAHAKILKGIKTRDKQVAVFKQIVAMGLSVKATEALLREQKENAAGAATSGTKDSAARSGGETKTSHVKSLENELRQSLGTPVEIRVTAKDKGQFIIHFQSHDDFERILERLQRK
ncbi:MAG: ParB/RepB/Spo0J family partition protein [Gemmataceae bacterium]|nr:ParB/RepB/Spo0J family partition protein [Gemmataceae bacterium]